MIEAGIHDGDLLVVDRSIEPGDGKIVVAALGGDLTVKRVVRRGGKLWLAPENPAHAPIEVDVELHVWGVVTHVVHDVA